MFLVSTAFAADTALRNLTDKATPTGADELYINDVSTTGLSASKKIRVSQLLNSGAGYLTGLNDATTNITPGTYLGADITVNSQGRLTSAAQGQLTSLSDVATSTKTAGNILVANGTNFASVSITGDATLSSAGDIQLGTGTVGATELSSIGTAGQYLAGDVVLDVDGRVTSAARGQLTSLSDVASSTKTAGNLLIANGTNFASVGINGSCTLTSSGYLNCNGSSALTGLSDVVNNGSSTYTNKNVLIANGSKFYSGALALTGLSDVSSNTKTAGNLLVADGTNFVSVAMSGSCSLNSAGAISCSAAGGKFYQVLEPQTAKLPAVNADAIDAANNQWRGLFDAAGSETGRWEGVLYPYTSGLNAKICYSMVSATSGTVEFDLSIMCNSSGDAADIDTDSFGSANVFTETVPGTAGYESCITVTSLSEDSCAQYDHIIYKVNRDATDGTNDTATGDAELRKIILYEN